MTTSREIVNNLIRGKGADRVGIWDDPWLDTIKCWVDQGYPTRIVHKLIGEKWWSRTNGRWYVVEHEDNYEEPIPIWEHFMYDMNEMGPEFDDLPLRNYSEIVEETNEWESRRNGAGAVIKNWKNHSGAPQKVEFRMVTRDIWERDYRPYLIEFDPLRIDIPEMLKNKGIQDKAQIFTTFGHTFVWELARQSMGDITLYESLLLDPGWIHDYNRIYTDLYKKILTYTFDKVGKPDAFTLYEDLGYRSGLFASPKVLSELYFPYYKELIDFFHGNDIPVILHSCGSVADALPLVVEVGFDALNPMERKADKNDPFLFAEKYGDKLAFIGGFDARILETNDKDLIRQEVSRYIEGLKVRGARLVFASDHSISTNVHYDTYSYAVDIYREHMLY